MGITLFYSLLFSCIMKVFILLAIVVCALVAVSEANTKCQKGAGGHKGAHYRGHVAHTKSGKKCQKWTAQKPHKHTRTPGNKRYHGKGLGPHNHCRNPDGEKGGVWCYTTTAKRWEFCHVHTCGK